MSAEADRKLIKGILKRERKVLSYLEAAYKPLVLALATKMGLSNDGENVWKVVFSTVVEKIEAFRGECSLKGWIYKIAYNQCLSQLRSLPSDEVPSDDLNKMDPPADLLLTPSETEAGSIARDLIQEALDKLPKEQKDAILLRYYYGYSLAQTAKMKGIPETTITTNLYLGLKRMRHWTETKSD